MRILVVGGTRFIGRLFVEAALGRGHEVTLLHRGASGEDLFPQAEHRHADRDGDLGVLAGGRWDATVDLSAYFPRQVRSLAAALDGRGGHYTYVSSISAYADPTGPGTVEGSPLLEPAADDVDQITAESYGRLKVSCELAAAELFTDGLLVVRPTYVVGPYDSTGRFTWWVLRLADGGEVLAPGAPDLPIQVIDGRDLTAWMLDLGGAPSDRGVPRGQPAAAARLRGPARRRGRRGGPRGDLPQLGGRGVPAGRRRGRRVAAPVAGR